MSGSGEPTKKCPDCGIAKPLTAFSRNSARPDGLQFYCKSCYSVRSARNYRSRQQRRGKSVRERVSAPPGYKHCPGCQRIQPRSEWHKRSSSPDGLVVYCKTCSKARHRRDHLKRRFGLTPDALEELIAAQGGVCAICQDGKPEHIDHDHRTGRVRGVLCGPCNMGLGLFKDDVWRLRAASEYLYRNLVAALGLNITEVEHTDVIVEIDFRWPHAA